MKNKFFLNIATLLFLATNFIHAMASAPLTPQEKLKRAHKSVAVLEQQIAQQEQALGLPQLLIDTLETAAARNGFPNIGVEDLAWIIGNYTTSVEDPHNPGQIIGIWKPLQRVNGRLNRDDAHQQLVRELKNSRAQLKQENNKRNLAREEVADDLVHQKNARFLQGFSACIAFIGYSPNTALNFIKAFYKLSSENLELRIKNAGKGALKASILHSLYATYLIKRYNHATDLHFANILKISLYYMLLDLTHKYGSDITEMIISTEKLHDYLSKKVDNYDAKKAKLEWALKTLIASKADRWIIKLSGQV